MNLLQYSLALKFSISIIGLTTFIQAQTIPSEYYDFVSTADSLYKQKKYQQSGATYTKAFATMEGRGILTDKYNAARSWAQGGFSDSSFFYLNRIVDSADYANMKHLQSDSSMVSLHNDSRWSNLITRVKRNRIKIVGENYEPNLNQLDSIYEDDQKYRLMIGEISKKHGRDSKEMTELLKQMNEHDKINLIKVEIILEKFGWPEIGEVSRNGNSAIFLVLQHADFQTQMYYLPIMREALKKGKILPSSFALFEDRIAIRQGKKQIYGSQIIRDRKTGDFIIAPIEDEPNVNKRRESVGLSPLEDYVKMWGIKYKLPNK